MRPPCATSATDTAMTKKTTKERVDLLKILERALESIITEAAVAYPLTEDPLVIQAWIRGTTRYVMGAVRRKDVPNQKLYKGLTEDQKVQVVLDKTREKLAEIDKREERQQRVEMLMETEFPGPAPKPPPESDPSRPRSPG